MTTVANFRLGFTVNGRQAIRSMDRISDRVSRLGRSFGGFNTLIAGVLVQRAVSNAASLADEYTNVNAQVGLIAKSQEDVLRLQAGALRVAIDTRTTLAGTATLITRLGRSAERFGASTEQVLVVSQAVAETFRISGATAKEAESSTIQLAQALGKGRLDGEELKSVLEGNLFISQIIAEEFETSVDQLRELGEQGKLVSSRVFKALLEDSQRINETFSSLPKTFGDSFQLARTTFQTIIGEINTASGASEDLFKLVKGITEEILTGSLVDIGAGFIEAVGDAQAFLKIAEIVGTQLSLVFLIARREFGSFVSDIKLFLNEKLPNFAPALGLDLNEFDKFRQKFEQTGDTTSAVTGTIRRDLKGVAAAANEVSGLGVLELEIRPDQINRDEILTAINLLVDKRTELEEELATIAVDNVRSTSETRRNLQERVRAVQEAAEEIKRIRNTTLEGSGGIPSLEEDRALIDSLSSRDFIDAMKLRREEIEREAALTQRALDDITFVAADSFDAFLTDLNEGLGQAAKSFTKVWLDAIRNILISSLANQFVSFLSGIATQGGTRQSSGLAGALIGAFTGFRNGGSFGVGGNGGADSQLVAFRASPNERVTIQTPSQQRGQASGLTINQHLNLTGSGLDRGDVELLLAQNKKQTVAEVQRLRQKGRI